jgi:nitrite reductase (NADH) large subunit
MSNKDSSSSRKILVVGSGAAGLAAVRAARTQDSGAQITMFGLENRLPYYRLRLIEYIGKSIKYDELEINKEEWFKQNNIQLELASKVTAIDTDAKKISINDKEYSYDSLVLATGSFPIMPPFKGAGLAGVHSIWTWDDIAEINKSLEKAKNAVVIGGGLLGLEAAYKLSEMGLKVSLIEGMPRLLPKQLDEEGSEVFRGKVQSLGIQVFCGVSVAGFEGDDNGRVKQVRMADDTLLDADIVIVSVGVAPNTAIFKDRGFDLDRFLKVNDKMVTNIKDVYAAGDLASVDGRWFGQWSVASSQGQVAGTNAAGGNAVYKIIDVPYMLNTMGTKVACAGETSIVQSDSSEISYEIDQKLDEVKFDYSKLVFRDGLFVGYILIGEPAKAFSKLQSMLKTYASAETINNILYS